MYIKQLRSAPELRLRYLVATIVIAEGMKNRRSSKGGAVYSTPRFVLPADSIREAVVITSRHGHSLLGERKWHRG